MGYAAYALEERQRQGQTESLEEYAELKNQLLMRTQRAGAFLAGYLFLTVSGTVRELDRSLALSDSVLSDADD